MHSSQQPLLVNIIAFDADGCLYSKRKYVRVFIRLVDKYWDFFKIFYTKYYEKIPLADAEKNEVAKIIKTMIAELKQIHFQNYDRLEDQAPVEITSNSLKVQITRNRKYLPNKGISELDLLGLMLGKFVDFLNYHDRQLLETLFILANKECFDWKIQQLKDENFAAYQIAFGTNRQSIVHDKLGREQTGTDSIHVNYYHLLNYFRIGLSDAHILGELNTLTLGDVYAGIEEKTRAKIPFQRGSTHQKILEEYNGKAIHRDHPAYIYDSSKLTLLYVLAHDALQNSATEFNLRGRVIHFVMDFFDNEMPLLIALRDTLLKFPEWLPRGVRLRLFHYHGVINKEPFAIIEGQGLHDKNYVENIRRIPALCGFNFKDMDVAINVATQLDIARFLKDRVMEVETRLIGMKGSLFDRNPNQPQSKKAKCEDGVKPEQGGANLPSYH